MIRILHIVNSFDIGGMENGLVNVINYSDGSTFQHSICSLTTIGKMKERIHSPNAAYYSLGKIGIDRFMFLKLYQVIKQIQPHIIHVRGWGPFFDAVISATFSRCRPKIIFSFHGKVYHDYSLQKGFSRFIRIKLLCMVDQIMTLNKRMRQDLSLMCHIPEHKIKIIENGIDTALFSPDIVHKDALNEMKQLFGVKHNHFVIGMAGRLAKIKHIEFVIKSIRYIKNKIPDIVLLIVGEGEEYENLLRLTKELSLEKHVIFTGKQDHMHTIYPLMDIYVQSSFYEGFSNTILEAMSSGLPVVCSDVGGNACLVTHGINGYLFESGNHDQFVKYIMDLFENPELRHNFSQKSRKTVEQKWSIDIMAENYESMYLEVLTNKAVNRR